MNDNHRIMESWRKLSLEKRVRFARVRDFHMGYPYRANTAKTGITFYWVYSTAN